MRSFSVLLSVLALAGCGGSFFHSNAPSPSVYLLSVKAGGVGPNLPADLTVLPPRVRTGLDTDFIAALYSDRRLDHFAGAHWSGPLDEVVQDLALQALGRGTKLHNAHADHSAFGGGYWLEIEVLDFQAEYPGTEGDSGPPTAHVHVVARLGAAGDRHIVGQFDADAREPAAQNRLAAIVAAFNQAADTALGKIAADTSEALNKDLERR